MFTITVVFKKAWRKVIAFERDDGNFLYHSPFTNQPIEVNPALVDQILDSERFIKSFACLLSEKDKEHIKNEKVKLIDNRFLVHYGMDLNRNNIFDRSSKIVNSPELDTFFLYPVGLHKNLKSNRTQLPEFIGDKIFSIAALELVEGKGIVDKKSIFYWSLGLITNNNLSGGNNIESFVGEIYKSKGFVVALAVAKEFLQTTNMWYQFERYLHNNRPNLNHLQNYEI